MAQIINLTKETLNIKTKDGDVVRIESSGVARCSRKIEVVDQISYSRDAKPNHYKYINVNKIKYGEILDLPEPSPGKLYCVSRLVAEAVRDSGRKDIVTPGPEIRDSEARVIAVDGVSVI